MAEIRILLVHPVGILRDIVRDMLAREHDLLIVEQLPDAQELSDVLDRTRADLVICGLDSRDLAGMWQPLLMSHPRVKVLDLREDGREAFLWELRLHRSVLGEASPALLIDVARKAAG